MSFLFKSSKKGAPGSTPNALPPATRDIRSSDGSAAPIPSFNGIGKPGSPTPMSINNSLNSIGAPDRSGATSRPSDDTQRTRDDGMRGVAPGQATQEQKMLRDPSREPPQKMPPQTRAPNENSPYPWSQRRMNFSPGNPNPFPRYGAAVNASASKDGCVYLMGGLINGSTVKGDLWMVEASGGNMGCHPVATTSEGPGPRVGHASLLVGNAFIVFGGDTKMDEGDMLDDTLYLLNTSTKQWSRALPAGPRPPGRYGHTLNILGSKIYVFGGQVEGYFFNDLVAFDLNALQQPTNKWEVLVQNTIDGGPPHGQIPPARTNHTMIAYGDKLYLFGGTDGVHWFNDVWAYTPNTNSWQLQECIGYIPSPREGHAAAVVGDVMYIFGGRTEEGTDLGDLAAFRIGTRRWYTFQNMGPSPSPRSGHSMTTVGKQVVILAGEPSSAPRDPIELAMAYFLDTTKIRYPADSGSQTPVNERISGHKRPSGERNGSIGSQQRGQPSRELSERSREGSSEPRIRSPDGARVPRVQGQLPAPAPTGPPPQAPGQARQGVISPVSRQPTRTSDRAFSPSDENDRPQQLFANAGISAAEGARSSPAPRDVRGPTSPAFEPEPAYYEPEQRPEPQARQKPETYQPSQDPNDPYPRSNSRNQSSRAETDRFPQPGRETPRASADNEPLSRVRKISDESQGPQDSGIGSSPALTQQYDEMARELEQAKHRNAWHSSELALARKSGYQARSADSPVIDQRASAVTHDDDKPLVEALLKTRAELSRVLETFDQHRQSSAERIAEVEKQRGLAVSEAEHAKARLTGQGIPLPGADGQPEHNREISRKLTSSLEAQSDLGRRIESLTREIEAERRSRELAEETADAAQKRVAELDTYRQQHASELETLRADLHEAQQDAREASANHAEISSQHQILSVDRSELSSKLERTLADTQSHTSILTSLREAVTASTDKAQMLEQKLEEERSGRSQLEQSLRELRTQHDARSGELDTTSRQLRDAQDLAQKHAEEARTHRSVVLAGLGNITHRAVEPSGPSQERLTVLQQQVEAANGLVRQNQAAADAASDKLRRAEERIAGLEAYQEQASREGLSIRKQLQTALKENQGLSSEKSDLEQKMERHLLESNALSVQHTSLKDVLAERGVSASDKRRSRALDSPGSQRFSTPDLHRVRDLEQQLEASLKSHDDMKSQFEDISERDEKMKREYEEKLTALDNDHQAAVKYLRGTEKMLSKMKQELQRVKNENGDLKKKMDKAKDDPEMSRGGIAGDVGAEHEKLKRDVEELQASHKTSIADLEGRIGAIQAQLQNAETDLHLAKSNHATSQRNLSDLQASHSQSRTDLDRLQKENSALEERAKDAENKVQLLLDQVESSVDNYRRQSRQVGATGGIPTLNGTHHVRNASDDPSEADGPAPHHDGATHSRNLSTGGDSTFSTVDEAATGDARNSLALDSLASELETLRSHWETTNRTYRLSDRFDAPTHPAAAGSTLADWRKGLEMDEDDEGTRPNTSTSTVKGEAALGEDFITPTGKMPGGLI